MSTTNHNCETWDGRHSGPSTTVSRRESMTKIDPGLTAISRVSSSEPRTVPSLSKVKDRPRKRGARGDYTILRYVSSRRPKSRGLNILITQREHPGTSPDMSPALWQIYQAIQLTIASPPLIAAPGEGAPLKRSALTGIITCFLAIKLAHLEAEKIDWISVKDLGLISSFWNHNQGDELDLYAPLGTIKYKARNRFRLQAI